MSEPETRPNCYRGEVGEVCQSVPLPISENKADNSSSISSTVNTDNSVNKTLPWVALAMLIAGVALGMSIASYVSSRDAVKTFEQRYELDKRDILVRVNLLDNHTQRAINQLDVMEKLHAADRPR
jgi:hypothetical protein